MGLTGNPMVVLCGFSLSLTMPPYAQLGGGQQDASSILNGMPPDVLAKVQSLAQILQQGLKDGKISETEHSTRLDVWASWRNAEATEPRGHSASGRNQCCIEGREGTGEKKA